MGRAQLAGLSLSHMVSAGVNGGRRSISKLTSSPTCLSLAGRGLSEAPFSPHAVSESLYCASLAALSDFLHSSTGLQDEEAKLTVHLSAMSRIETASFPLDSIGQSSHRLAYVLRGGEIDLMC